MARACAKAPTMPPVATGLGGSESLLSMCLSVVPPLICSRSPPLPSLDDSECSTRFRVVPLCIWSNRPALPGFDGERGAPLGAPDGGGGGGIGAAGGGGGGAGTPAGGGGGTALLVAGGGGGATAGCRMWGCAAALLGGGGGGPVIPRFGGGGGGAPPALVGGGGGAPCLEGGGGGGLAWDDCTGALLVGVEGGAVKVQKHFVSMKIKETWIFHKSQVFKLCITPPCFCLHTSDIHPNVHCHILFLASN